MPSGRSGSARSEGESPQSKGMSSRLQPDDPTPAFTAIPPGRRSETGIVISSDHRTLDIPRIVAEAVDRLRSSSLHEPVKTVVISGQLPKGGDGRLKLGLRPIFSVRRFGVGEVRPRPSGSQDNIVAVAQVSTDALVPRTPVDLTSRLFWAEIPLPRDSENATAETDRLVGRLGWVFAPQKAAVGRERVTGLRAGPYRTQSAAGAVCAYVRSRGELCRVVPM
jgi:hypothetical protein